MASQCIGLDTVEENEGQEPMFNFVPLVGGRRIMSHGDRHQFFVGKVLELFLPEPISGPVGATSIGSDEQMVLAGIKRCATAVPLPSDALDGKLSGIMINAHIDEPLIVSQDHRCHTAPPSHRQAKEGHTHSR